MVCQSIRRWKEQWLFDNVFMVYVLYVCILCIFAVEMYHISMERQDLHGQDSKDARLNMLKGDKTIRFASMGVADDSVMQRVKGCMNNVYVDQFAGNIAVGSFLSTFRYGSDELHAALKLGVSLRKSTVSGGRKWLDFILITHYERDYDSRAEVTMLKMAGWTCVCFVAPVVPKWMMRKSKLGSIPDNVGFLYGQSLVGYDNVLMIPVVSLVVGDLSSLVFTSDFLLSTEGNGDDAGVEDSMQLGFPGDVYFSCCGGIGAMLLKPNEQSYYSALSMVRKGVSDGHDMGSVFDGVFNVTKWVGDTLLCDARVLDDSEDYDMERCYVVVFSDKKPWDYVNCRLYWQVSKWCNVWNEAKTTYH